jgi:hypothetical protein
MESVNVDKHFRYCNGQKILQIGTNISQRIEMSCYPTKNNGKLQFRSENRKRLHLIVKPLIRFNLIIGTFHVQTFFFFSTQESVRSS